MAESGGQVDVIFDQHWRLYRKVIESNYMDHEEIVEAISNHWVKTAGGKPMGRVLDLGCGDAEVPSQIVEQFGCVSFTGVDSSGKALEEAAKRPIWDTVESRWITADLRDLSQLDREKFDTVFAGFTAHHLSREEKEAFLGEIGRLLKQDGIFYFFDVFLLESMEREESIDRYLEWIAEDWKKITKAEYDMIDTHIRAADFPETVSWIDEAVKKAGLCISRVRLPIKNKFHLAFALTRKSP